MNQLPACARRHSDSSAKVCMVSDTHTHTHGHTVTTSDVATGKLLHHVFTDEQISSERKYSRFIVYFF